MANQEDPALKISKELHARVCSMIYPADGKRNFKSADAVIRFLFQQYDEKIKQKMNSITNKESGCTFKIPPQALADAGLKLGDTLEVSVEDGKIILEKQKI